MPGLSPRTQQFMQPPPSQADADRVFEDGFSQMAQSALAGEFPELMENVITFKVLASDIDNGGGVGAFMLSLNGETLFIPVVLASNQIKPLDLVYYQDKNIFLPLDRDWIDEISRNSLDDLGEGVEPPKTLSPDVDIRNLVVPPSVGRHVYAAYQVPGEKLAQFLTAAPNRVKKAFKLVLEKNHDVLKYAFENFDRTQLMDALRPHIEKTASIPELVAVLGTEDPAEHFRKFFGKEAGTAWQEAVKKGYVIADKRKRTNKVVEIQEPIVRTTAQENGFYRIHMQDGSTKLALVISEPQSFQSPMYAGKRTDMRRTPNEYWKTHKKTHDQVLVNEYASSEEPSHDQKGQKFLIYTEDGNIITSTEAPVGRWVPPEEVKGPLAQILKNKSQPATQGHGFFVSFRGGKIQGTDTIDIIRVTTGSDGTRRMETTFLGGRTLVTDPRSPIMQIVAPYSGNVTYIPQHFKFIKGRYVPPQILRGADDTLSYINELEKQGALKIKIKDAGAGMFSIGGLTSDTKLATLRTLVHDLEIPGAEAENLLEKTSQRRHHSFYLVNPAQFAKFASWAKKAQEVSPMMPSEAQPAAMGGGMPPEAAGMGGAPPGMEGMPPEDGMEGMPPEAGMPAAAPPPPSPVDQAAAEVEADLAQQTAHISAQLAEQQRDLANQLSAIAAVKQRAEQIAMSQMGAMPAGPPEQVPQTPPPGMEAGMPEQGMPGQMAPEQGMGMGGPETGLPPQAAGMPVEEPMSSEQLAASAGPMMGEAAALQEPEAFEATAIGSMATDADLREAVTEYLPSLEKALDNLGRILLTLWIKEDELRAELGEADFMDLEKRIRPVFNNLGSLILRINQTAMATPEEDEDDETT